MTDEILKIESDKSIGLMPKGWQPTAELKVNQMTHPSYCCPKCGEQIGYIGRFFQFLRIPLHRCKK